MTAKKANRCCEVCSHLWHSKYGPDWILLCPKCRVSGYHEYILVKAFFEAAGVETDDLHRRMLAKLIEERDKGCDTPALHEAIRQFTEVIGLTEETQPLKYPGQ
jgi:hypothetical protein